MQYYICKCREMHTHFFHLVPPFSDAVTEPGYTWVSRENTRSLSSSRLPALFAGGGRIRKLWKYLMSLQNTSSVSTQKRESWIFVLITPPLVGVHCVGGNKHTVGGGAMRLRSYQKPKVSIKSKGWENTFPLTDQLTGWPKLAGGCS